jgi:hypothetical protein
MTQAQCMGNTFQYWPIYIHQSKLIQRRTMQIADHAELLNCLHQQIFQLVQLRLEIIATWASDFC